MVAYCRRARVSPEVVMFHARNPCHRSWRERGDLQWTMRLEAPSWIWAERQSTVQVGSDPLWLVFERGALVRFAWVPARTHLGELTESELLRLLETSEVRATGEWERFTARRNLLA